MNSTVSKINESYGTEIIQINDKFQLKLVEGYYYKPYLIKEPKNQSMEFSLEIIENITVGKWYGVFRKQNGCRSTPQQ